MKQDLKPVLESGDVRFILVEKPRYRESRWSTLRREVCEYESPAMRKLWDARQADARQADAAQVEYTQLARYGGDILVEHDVTWDLQAQVLKRRRTFAAWWDWKRWRRFEDRAVREFPAVVTMSEKDRALLGVPHTRVIENGVDLERFEAAPGKTPGRRLLFIGSFRHFPNVAAFRFLIEEILPLVPDAELTVVAGPDPWPHWSNATGTLHPPPNPRVTMLEFVADVVPLYRQANVVVVPTLESAGTNVKVLEALAFMERGCGQLDGPQVARASAWSMASLVWIADSAEAYR